MYLNATTRRSSPFGRRSFITSRPRSVLHINRGMSSYLSADTPAGEKTSFLSFSQASIVGDISFLLLCGVGVMLIAPSLPTLAQKIKGIVSR